MAASLPPFESCLFAQSSPLTGVIVLDVTGDPDGPAIFRFDTVIDAAAVEVGGFSLYYPTHGWIDAVTLSGGGDGEAFIRLGDNVGEYPTSWRFIPPSSGITFVGGAQLESLQSGTTL